MVRIRSPILFTAIVALLALGLAAPAAIAQLPGGTLPPGDIPKYVIPLVIPPVMNDIAPPNNRQDNRYQIAVRQFQQQILPGGIWDTVADPDDDFPNFPPTTVWSYGPFMDMLPDSSALGGGVGIAPAPNSQFNYPAYTVETMSNVPVWVRWINDLKEDFGRGRNCLSHLLPIDQTLHWANPPMDCRMGDPRTDCAGDNPEPYTGPVPIVTHVHGAHVDPHSDGYPEAWWLPNCNIPRGYATEGTFFDDARGQRRGLNRGFADYYYRQDQPATTLWYHDHSLGMTRSNVYAGPAGFWLVRGGDNDQVDDTSTLDAPNDGVLPGPAPAPGEGVLQVNLTDRAKYREIPIVIQDRSFNADGSLFYPDNRAFFEGLNPEGAGPPELQIDFVPDSDIAPIWNPEAFFNTMVVNGVVWPTHAVAPAKYRFRFLNGCNSRFLILRLVFVPSSGDVNDPEDWVQVPGAFWQIGAEQGFLPEPVPLGELLMGLAERADVIMDFAAIDDYIRTNHPDVFRYNLYLVNVGPDEPFGGGTPGVDFDPADPETTGQVMQFVLDADLFGESPTDATATDPPDLALNAEDPLGAAVGSPRTLSLNEGESEVVCVKDDNGNLVQQFDSGTGEPLDPPDCEDSILGDVGAEPFGPKEALLGIVEAGVPIPLKWTDTTKGALVNVTLRNRSVIPVWVTENPTVGDTEQWDIYNVTADAHPIHLHLVRFQVINRGPLFQVDGEVRIPILLGDAPPRGPEPWETGYKDTVIAYPGEVTRVKAKFDIEGLYVWHCHIVEHEDNEMMRPYVVSATP